jgi:hypothetical protein
MSSAVTASKEDELVIDQYEQEGYGKFYDVFMDKNDKNSFHFTDEEQYCMRKFIDDEKWINAIEANCNVAVNPKNLKISRSSCDILIERIFDFFEERIKTYNNEIPDEDVDCLFEYHPQSYIKEEILSFVVLSEACDLSEELKQKYRKKFLAYVKKLAEEIVECNHELEHQDSASFPVAWTIFGVLTVLAIIIAVAVLLFVNRRQAQP